MSVKWHGDQVKATIKAATVRGLRKAAEHLLTESRKVVPIEEGTLERSGVASVDASQLKAAVSYDTVYAVRQHEELDNRHDAGRRAKYLEGPMHEQAPKIRALVAKDIRKAIQ